jgi:hypothetical protein
MSIWVIAPVTAEPEAVLTRWCIFETDKDTRHFVGYDGRSGRVSSFIVEFDPKTRKGTTASGRVYQLRGPQPWQQRRGLRVAALVCRMRSREVRRRVGTDDSWMQIRGRTA